MRNYNDSSARDAAARLLSLVNRVTILREKEPSDALKLLAGTAECIINGDCMGAYIKHCALCRALIKSPARRVSGSIFTDYLIHLAVRKYPVLQGKYLVRTGVALYKNRSA